MRICAVCGFLASAGLATAALGQAGAPTSAQVWDVQFVIDQSGPFAEGATASAVGITLVARVGIRPNTSPFGTENLGVWRVGGSGTPASGFRMLFNDAVSGGAGLGQGTIASGQTATGPFAETPRNDASGDPLSGAFFPFRSSFDPAGLPNPGDNDNPFNGTFVNPAMGNPVATNITLDRARGWNTVPTPLGVATLDAAGNITGGDYAAVYRFLYTPRAAGDRQITVSVLGMSARYAFQRQGDFSLNGAIFNLPTMSFSFRVPAPGAAAMVGPAGLALCRRRRRD
jgi:hypothetical protein